MRITHTSTTMNHPPIIFIAKLPSREAQPWLKTPIYPPERQAEILACVSEKVQKEKYFVWKLLELALWETCGKRLQELTFSKSEHGKWRCDGAEFSLSHSENAVCVAVMTSPEKLSSGAESDSGLSKAVGVDLQKIKDVRADALTTKILTETELGEYHALGDYEKNAFLIHAWAKKESLFKAVGGSGFFTFDPKSFAGDVWQSTVTLDGEDYTLAVATKSTLTPIIRFVELSI